jgi:ribosomal protein L16 Arg81 hydroxylase
MAAFPTYARVLLDGYAVQQASALKRSEMDSGPAKQRLDRSRQMVERAVTVQLRSRADYEAFKVWFRDTIHRGADWFDWNDSESLAVVQGRIKNGEMQRRPMNSALTLWHVSFTLESWDE